MSSASHQTRVSFEEAQQIILERAIAGTRIVEVPVASASGSVLAEEVRSPLDMPPFNKAAMDGFAFQWADAEESDTFRIVATVAAGDAPGGSLQSGECIRIMTGAPVPLPADTVVPVEETSLLEEDRVKFHDVPARGMHIALQAEDIRTGDVAVKAGHRIQHQDVAILAAVGRCTVKVYDDPTIAFAATGEELVEPGTPLKPGQIYNSNASCLRSQILRARGRPHPLGTLRDDPQELRDSILAGLEHDMLILSGGVSMGTFDYVPEVFRSLGVEILFHQLLVKPAKPTLFGVRDSTLVFGLPGNPVSTLYAFDQYVALAIRVFQRHPQPQTTHYRGELTQSTSGAGNRLLLVPCVCDWAGDHYLLTPLGHHGSADIFAISGANALALIPAGIDEVRRGQMVSFRKLYND